MATIIPTKEQIQYMQAHIDDSLAPSIHISNGILIGAASISVILRYVARRQSTGGLGKDDFMLFFSFFLYLVFVAGFSVGTRYGFGKHILAVTDLRAFAIILLFIYCSYVFAMVGVKLSILLLYRRIFPTRQFQKRLLGVSAVVMAWFFAALFFSIFNCYPISKSWDPSTSGRCINFGTVTLVIGIANILIDFTLFGLPMPLLWDLNMSTRKKVLLSSMFAVGCSACVVSIPRLAFARLVASTYDPSWYNVIPGILSGLEICTGIVACCAITYRPLIERLYSLLINSSQDEFLSGPSTGCGSNNRQGWNKIHVQHDVEPSYRTRQDEQASVDQMTMPMSSPLIISRH
ncbi:hypothetical protein F4680DRAFT_460329 [Xylaria scruposa]|nr:hypothetical protein F4680DRAFT_460329 [Xylaria scruposa]